jgi:hypothetical protein
VQETGQGSRPRNDAGGHFRTQFFGHDPRRQFAETAIFSASPQRRSRP